MELLSYTYDLSNIDCHIHSRFSPDARNAGADEPQKIADTVRAKGLRGFIATDHIDVGHWKDFAPLDFDAYFTTWEKVKRDNPDLDIHVGLEVGYEKKHAKETARLIADLPLEYIINSVHYFGKDVFALGKKKAYAEYLNAVLASLDAPYPFTTIGHLGFAERYAPYDISERVIAYDEFEPILRKIAERAVERKIRFEENTNTDGEMRCPRSDFLRAYKDMGGVRPVLGSDAHVSARIGAHFDIATKFLDGIFG